MRIFGAGWLEILIIILIIAVIFGPSLFKKVGSRFKETADSAKKGLEAGVEASGADIDLDNLSKDDVLDKVEELQDKMGEKLDEITQANENAAEEISK